MTTICLFRFASCFSSCCSDVLVVHGSCCGGETACSSDVSSVALVLCCYCLLFGAIVLVCPMCQATQARLFANLVLDVGNDAVETSKLLSEGAVCFCHDNILFVEVGDHVSNDMAERLELGSS